MKGQCRRPQSDTAMVEGGGVSRELNVLALFKGEERFIFVYDDESRDGLIDELRHKAADPDVALNWFDAAVLTERVRHPADVEPSTVDIEE